MPAKKKTLTEELAALREQRVTYITEAEDIAGRALPLEEYGVDEAIASKALLWQPDLRGLLHPGNGPSDFSLMPVIFRGEPRDGTVQPDIREAVTVTLSALSPGIVRTKLLEAIERHISEHGPALGREEREQRLAALDTKIRDLEVKEEVVIRAAASDGVQLARRGDASPAVVLGDLNEQHAA